jgi:hypothetical protein
MRNCALPTNAWLADGDPSPVLPAGRTAWYVSIWDRSCFPQRVVFGEEADHALTHGYAARATTHTEADDHRHPAADTAMTSSYALSPLRQRGVPVVVHGHPTEMVGAGAREVVLGDRASAGDGTDPDRACTRCGHLASDAVSRVPPTH